MIDRYRDHAANERTMLAWVRTALAIIGFGVVVEKLNLFLRLSNLVQDGAAQSALASQWLGLALIATGIATIAMALKHYVAIAQAIDAAHTVEMKTARSDALLFLMIAVAVVAVALLFAHAVGLFF